MSLLLSLETLTVKPHNLLLMIAQTVILFLAMHPTNVPVTKICSMAHPMTALGVCWTIALGIYWSIALGIYWSIALGIYWKIALAIVLCLVGDPMPTTVTGPSEAPDLIGLPPPPPATGRCQATNRHLAVPP